MKKKIVILLLSLFLFFLGGIFVTLYMIFQTTANLDSLITLHKVEIIRQELVINVQKVQSNLYTTGTMFGKELDIIVDNVLKLRNAVQRCGSCHHVPSVDLAIKDLQEMTEQYQESLSYFITSTADKKRIERLQTIAADIGDSIISKSQAMALSANESLRKKTIEATRKVNTSKNILGYTIFSSFIISAAIALFLIKSITEPVSELLKATRKIKSGELGYTSSYVGQNEFRELIGSFNEMSKSLKETNEEILSQMTRNQTILQTSIDGFVLFDEEGLILDVNPALCTMLGYDEEELLHKKFTEIGLFDLKFEREQLLNRIKAANSLIFQLDQKTKDGTVVTVEISATFTEMEGRGNFFCFIRDITQRRKMEAELLKVQKLESLGVLAGGVAHDFNNLLAGILGNIDLAMKCLGPQDKVYDKLANAKKATGRAQNLTHQLLTFSRGGEPIKQPLSIAKLIEESTRFILSGSNVRSDYHLPDNLWIVEADKGQISQVIQNITLNADQAMPRGGTITVSAENVVIGENNSMPLTKGEYIKITFVDQGGGIEKKYLTKIFDPYFTTKQSGSGLGLTICHSIVNKHNGHLVVESTPGIGTTFTVYLPALQRESLPEAVATEDEVIMGAGSVLVMDDEEPLRVIVSEMLKHLGYEPDLASHGSEAIEMYKRAKTTGKPYTAVIMDLTIPGGMGGKEAIAELLRFDPEVKAIVSSGYSNDPIMAEYRKYGFQGVVSKPFDTEQLSKALYNLLKQSSYH